MDFTDICFVESRACKKLHSAPLSSFCILPSVHFEKHVNLLIITLINVLDVLSIKYQKVIKKCRPKPKTTSSSVLFCPQPKDNQFTVIEEEINQEIITLRSWNQIIFTQIE